MTTKYSGYECFGDIPLTWNMLPIRAIYDERKDKNTYNTVTQVLSLLKDIGVIPYEEKGDIGNKMTNTPENHKIVKKGDLVVNKMNAVIGSLGISRYKGTVSQIYFVLRLKDNACNNEYLEYIFKYRGFQKSLRKISKGIMEIRESIDWLDFKNLRIPIPPTEEQNIIVNYLKSKEEKINLFVQKKQQFIKLLNNQRQGIITQAVTKGIDKSVKMKDTGIKWMQEIPAHWQVRRIRYLGSFQNGLNKNQEAFGSGYPFISYSDVYQNEILPNNPIGLANVDKTERERHSVRSGDIFFTRTSETIDEIGFSSVCIDTIADATFSGFLIRFRPIEDLLYPYFSQYYFRSQAHRAFFVKEMMLVTRASLSQDLLKDLPVLLPPIDEQKKIANYIKNETHSIDITISKAEREIELIKEFREAMIAEAVTGRAKVY